MEPVSYPLTWPDNLPRASRRDTSRFKAGLNTALNNVRGSLRLFSADSGRKLDNVIISSNCTLGDNRPADPGVAVWFVWDGKQVCFAVDRYLKVEHNLQAIHHIIEARRVELRHGGINIVRATFTGFQALPSPNGAGKRTWRQVFGWDDSQSVSADIIQARHRRLSKSRHPDHGGSVEEMSELNIAKEEALAELQGKL